MSAALCPRCRQPTSPVTGFCDACGWPRARKSAPENAAAVPAGAPPAASSGAAPPPFWQPAPPAWQPPPPAWQPAPPAPYGYPPPAPPYGYPPPPAPYGYPPPGVPGPLFVPPGYAAPRMVPVAQELARKSSGARWGAAFVDFLLIFVIWFEVLTLYRGAFADGPPGGAGFLAITLLIGFSYYIVPDAAGVGTVGKMLTGVRVYDINLKPASAAQIAVRSLELLAWAILFGLLFALLQSYYIGKNGQGVGDSIAKTYVIKKKELAPFVAPPA